MHALIARKNRWGHSWSRVPVNVSVQDGLEDYLNEVAEVALSMGSYHRIPTFSHPAHPEGIWCLFKMPLLGPEGEIEGQRWVWAYSRDKKYLPRKVYAQVDTRTDKTIAIDRLSQ